MKITEENLRQKGYRNSVPESPYNYGLEYWRYLRKNLDNGDIMVIINISNGNSNSSKSIGLISRFYKPTARQVVDTLEYVEFLEDTLKHYEWLQRKDSKNFKVKQKIDFIKRVLQELKSYDTGLS